MNIKTGLDILSLTHIRERAQNQRFLNKVFTEYELNYFNSKRVKNNEQKEFQTLAGIFCAKEAVLKAMGTGIQKLTYLQDIEIKHDKSGKPYIVVSGKVKELLQELKCVSCDINIAHDGDVAMAVCVLLTE